MSIPKPPPKSDVVNFIQHVIASHWDIHTTAFNLAIFSAVCLVYVSGITLVHIVARRLKAPPAPRDHTDNKPATGEAAGKPAASDQKPNPRTGKAQIFTTGDRFIVEAMVASGPRKSAQEYATAPLELCEDAAGVLSIDAGHQAWWLCDGTGNGASLLPPVGSHPGLNTRMFARELGDHFIGWVLKGEFPADDEEMGLLLSLVGEHWKKRIDGYLEALTDSGKLEEFYRNRNAEKTQTYQIKWSTTFLGAVIHSSPDEAPSMTALQIGDCGGIVVKIQVDGKQTGQAIAPNKDRVFAVATLTGAECEVQILTPNVLKCIEFTNVVGFAAMSDGVFRNVAHPDLASLLNHLAELASTRCSFAELREGLIATRERSFDDKSLVLGWRPA